MEENQEVQEMIMGPARPTKKQRKEALRAMLIARFPVFAEKKPLEVGAFYKIMTACPWLDEKDVQIFLKVWCFSKSYLENIIKDTHRYDLHGNPVGEITAEHKERAEKKLEELKASRALKEQNRAMTEAQRLASKQKKEKHQKMMDALEKKKAQKAEQHKRWLQKNREQNQRQKEQRDDVKVTVKKSRNFHYPKDLRGE